MKIGIDARVLGTNRALDRYTRNIIAQWSKQKTKKHNFVVFLRQGVSVKKMRLPEADNFRYLALKSTPTVFDHFFFYWRVRRQKLDVLFHPDNRSFLFCALPQVVVLHDLTPQKFPSLVLARDPLLYWRQRLYFSLQNRAIRKARRIITVSENTKKDVLAFFGLEKDQVRVVYEGVEERFQPWSPAKIGKILALYKIKRPYLFYLGGFGRHKNVLNLLKAFVLLKERHPRLQLVLGGKSSDSGSSGQNSYPLLAEFVAKNHLKRRARFTGYIAEQDLPAIYSGAKAFVYPSKYEGFGFPPLEAMACGTPVVCSPVASLPEVGGDAVLYGQSVDELVDSLDKILSRPALQKELSLKGLKQASKFSWQKCAKKSLKILEEVTTDG